MKASIDFRGCVFREFLEFEKLKESAAKGIQSRVDVTDQRQSRRQGASSEILLNSDFDFWISLDIRIFPRPIDISLAGRII